MSVGGATNFENDVVLNTEVFVGVNNEGIEYGRTPITQLDDSYEVAAYGENFGSETATNVAVNVESMVRSKTISLMSKRLGIILS